MDDIDALPPPPIETVNVCIITSPRTKRKAPQPPVVSSPSQPSTTVSCVDDKVDSESFESPTKPLPKTPKTNHQELFISFCTKLLQAVICDAVKTLSKKVKLVLFLSLVGLIFLFGKPFICY